MQCMLVSTTFFVIESLLLFVPTMHNFMLLWLPDKVWSRLMRDSVDFGDLSSPYCLASSANAKAISDVEALIQVNSLHTTASLNVGFPLPFLIWSLPAIYARLMPVPTSRSAWTYRSFHLVLKWSKLCNLAREAKPQALTPFPLRAPAHSV